MGSRVADAAFRRQEECALRQDLEPRKVGVLAEERKDIFADSCSKCVDFSLFISGYLSRFELPWLCLLRVFFPRHTVPRHLHSSPLHEAGLSVIYSRTGSASLVGRCYTGRDQRFRSNGRSRASVNEFRTSLHSCLLHGVGQVFNQRTVTDQSTLFCLP